MWLEVEVEAVAVEVDFLADVALAFLPISAPNMGEVKNVGVSTGSTALQSHCGREYYSSCL